uniref:Fungal lipase-type domain-containing protein n=1 Tax=viral metagenome TaxID=1070528 RepID=A0A6C0I886_9ZZZZ
MLFFIIFIVVLIIIVFVSNLSNLLFPCSKTDYIIYSGADDSLYKSNLTHYLNFVISAYNDVCNYPRYSAGENQVIQVSSSVKALWFEIVSQCGLVYIFDTYIVIAFRGTHFRADEFVDSQFRYYNYPGTTFNVHHGFHRYLSSCRTQILNIISQNSSKDIYITGHSLGAGVATLLAYELYTRYSNNKIHLYLYGCPRCVNKDLSIFMKNNLTEIVSVVNYFDLVPEAPERLGKYVSFTPIYIFGIQTYSDTGNHSIQVYSKGINYIEPLSVLN